MAKTIHDHFLNALEALGARADLPDGVAPSLGLRKGQPTDPHVERLLEGVAYLGARVQARLDDEFPELTDSLLGVLYPHLLLPFPSCLLAQMTPRRDLARVAHVPAGAPLLAEEAERHFPFRTAAPVTVWPVRIESAQLVAARFDAQRGSERGMLRIVLRCLDAKLRFDQLARDDLGALRLHARGPRARAIHALLCTRTVGVSWAEASDNPAPIRLAPDALAPGGFAPQDALLPWPTDGLPGLRLLTEYFAFPEKFLCVDVAGATRRASAGCGNALELRIHLSAIPAELERSLDRDSLALFCAPAINLFARPCQPIELTPGAIEWPLNPAPTGRMQPKDMEVWSVRSVRELRPDGGATDLRPAFGGMADPGRVPAYTLARRAAGAALRGSVVLLGMIAPQQSVTGSGYNRLAVEVLCTSRDTSRGRPLGDSPATLSAERGLPGVEATVQVIERASDSLRPPSSDGRAWRLIAHLSMNHLIRGDPAASAERIKALLQLYDLRRLPETQDAIRALVAARTSEGVARMPGPHSGVFGRAVDVTLEFDSTARHDVVFLLASVLEQVLRMQAPINGVVRTTVVVLGQPEPLHRFPARSGTRERL